MKRKYLVLAAMILSISAGTMSLSSKAYTAEEKAWAKSMLQSYGYSPDMAGAQQAYADYLSGKFNDICEQYGLPKQGVSEPETEAPEETERQRETENRRKTENRRETEWMTEPETESETEAESRMPSDWAALFEEEEVTETTGSIVMEEDQQVEDDGRVHFGQIRILEGVYEAELLEIWTDENLTPPILTEDTESMVCEEGLVYSDLVFRIRNLGTEELDAAELLQISVSDGIADYENGLLLKETENGKEFSEETVLLPEEEAVFHYGLAVSRERGSFTGAVTLYGEEYKLYYKFNTHPQKREVLEQEKALEAENFGSVMLKELNGTPSEGMELSLTLENASEQEMLTNELTAVMLVNGEHILRVPFEGEAVLPGESKEVRIGIEVPETWEEETELLLYWQGEWYEVYREQKNDE